MKNYDTDLFLHDLKRVPWDLIEVSNDPDDMGSHVGKSFLGSA